MAKKPILAVEVDGLKETLGAVRELEADLRKTTNREFRQAAGECARGLVAQLVRAAQTSGVPVAPRVASSIKVKSDRLPVVSIGGTKKVGRYGAPAARLMWGSERGPVSETNHFGVAHNEAGYWITPTVERFRGDQAVTAYRRAVYEILHRRGLV